MLRDRGKIKWVSLMLPEHVNLLRDWAKEDSYEKSKQIDEQHLELMNSIVLEAMEFRKTIEVTYYKNHRYTSVVGKLYRIDEINKQLYLVNDNKQIPPISFSSIVDVRVVEE